MRPRILLVDNYDSFTYNLAQAIGTIGADVDVRRADVVFPADVVAAPPHALVISPGPGTPERAGNSMALVRALSGKVPILGVCLGHQAIGAVFGGRVVRAPAVVHGKTSRVSHDGGALFAGIPSPFVATRYHSLVVDETTLPSVLRVTARSADGLLMAFKHETHPTFGVQFHPESVLTRHGPKLLANFLAEVTA
ncbi:MAG TPA: aminodeoxychorismate/anthranilate synthase component II [Candidatus Eremiobacteraceae bacterium]|nr:aminodeoxychorismate/anthranilate synthase component II [Candidatus Eremiobacteraceae bacterium]